MWGQRAAASACLQGNNLMKGGDSLAHNGQWHSRTGCLDTFLFWPELFQSRNNRRFFFPTCAFRSSWWLACNDPRYSFLKFNWGSLLFQDLQETSQLYHIEFYFFDTVISIRYWRFSIYLRTGQVSTCSFTAATDYFNLAVTRPLKWWWSLCAGRK